MRISSGPLSSGATCECRVEAAPIGEGEKMVFIPKKNLGVGHGHQVTTFATHSLAPLF